MGIVLEAGSVSNKQEDASTLKLLRVLDFVDVL